MTVKQIAQFSVIERQCTLVLYKNLTMIAPKMNIVEFANDVDPDEATHHEPPHLVLRCLYSSLKNSV